MTLIVAYKFSIIGKRASPGYPFYVIINHIIDKLTPVSHVTVLLLIKEFRHNIVRKVAVDLPTTLTML